MFYGRLTGKSIPRQWRVDTVKSHTHAGVIYRRNFPKYKTRRQRRPPDEWNGMLVAAKVLHEL